nr:hypothetical protein [Lysinibacillus timonensis]
MGLLQFSSENAFQNVFHQLLFAPLESKKLFQPTVLDKAADLINEPHGLNILLQLAPLFDQSGIFIGKPWESIEKLDPTLVRGTLHAGGTLAVAEVLSDLRILAIVRGEYKHPKMTAKEASDFLTRVLALNIDLLLMKETEENRVTKLYKDEQASEFLRFISEHCFSPRVFENLYKEIDLLAVQGPIVTNKINKLISSAKKLAEGQDVEPKLLKYVKAIYSPSNLALDTTENYEDKLKDASDTVLIQEAEQLRSSLVETRLVSIFHVIFLNYIINEKPDLLKYIFAVDDIAKRNLHFNNDLISSLISSSITIETRRSIYGLLRFLQRDLFTKEIVTELRELMQIPIHEKIIHKLNSRYKLQHDNDLRSIIISGIINILGMPLGIGQGFNPTCQSTRAISYWSQKEPVLLLKLCNQFLKNGSISMTFEGRTFSSEILSPVPLDDEINIDPISLLLVPHLDSIYFEMLKAAENRHQDPHKWVNPAFHITGVWPGFSDIYHDLNFIENFRLYYHPMYNPDVNIGLPQPVGITIYNRNGQVLGAHAILIQRIEPDPSGIMRVYFYNPNNDSLQTWGSQVQTSVTGNGELEGESSLPFEEFIHFIYAFHYPEN